MGCFACCTGCCAEDGAEDGDHSTATAHRYRRWEPAPPPVPPSPGQCAGPEDFEVLSVLGKGAYGRVLQVRKLDTKVHYAMKVMRKCDVLKRNQVRHTFTEHNLLQTVRHPFIVPLHFAFQTEDCLCLILELELGGELFFHLRRMGAFAEPQVRLYAAEILLALEALHAAGYVYRDLKPENVLLDAEGHVRLSDFGLAKFDVTALDAGGTTFCGTPSYMAPEVLLGTGHGVAVDFWSLGTLIFEMLSGAPPFYSKNLHAMYRQILGADLRIGPHVGRAARSLLEGLLVRDPLQRLGAKGGAKQIQAHTFFRGLDFARVLLYGYAPPFKPTLVGASPSAQALDLSNFDAEFTGLDPNVTLGEGGAAAGGAAALSEAEPASGLSPQAARQDHEMLCFSLWMALSLWLTPAATFAGAPTWRRPSPSPARHMPRGGSAHITPVMTGQRTLLAEKNLASPSQGRMDELVPPSLLAGSAAFARSPVDRIRQSTIHASAMASVVVGTCKALPAFGKWYSAAALAAPLCCALATAAVKGVASDLFAQFAIERRASLAELSLSRTAAFASFGTIYCGAFANWKYNTFYQALFGSATTVSAVAAKIGLDMLWSAPFVYFPLYFIVKGLFARRSPVASLREFLSPAGLSMLQRYWLVWLPVECIMWTCVPSHLRIAFICVVSLGWQVFLSTLSYRSPKDDADDLECPAMYDDVPESGMFGDSSVNQRACLPVMSS